MSICWCENPVHLGNRSSVQRHDMGRMGRGEKTTAVARMGLFWRVSSECQESGKHLWSHLLCGHRTSFLVYHPALTLPVCCRHSLPYMTAPNMETFATQTTVGVAWGPEWNEQIHIFHCSHNSHYSKHSIVRWAFTKMPTICISMRCRLLAA